MKLTGHRGARIGAPENTMAAFERAILAGVDMIETDVHRTRDGRLILMHDHALARTTQGDGLIRDHDYEEICALNAAHGTPYPPETPPTLEAFLALAESVPGLMINFELKDYPTAGDEAFAYRSCDETIAMIERFGLRNRAVINSFSGKLLEYVLDRYPGRYPIHGFYPLFVMRDVTRDPLSYMNFGCLWHAQRDEQGVVHPLNSEFCPAEWYETLKKRHIEPWLGPAVKSEAALLYAERNGARMVCADDPLAMRDTLAKLSIRG